MLGIILDRLRPEAERVVAAGRIFGLRMLCGGCLQRWQDLYHVFIDFKRAFNRVWHTALWTTMRLYNINTNLVNSIQSLCSGAASAVCFNGSTGDWFRTTVGVRQGCLLSPTLLNIFLERIMAEALEDHKSTVSIGGRTISGLHFADDMNSLAGWELELANMVERLDKTSTACSMQISAEKTKLMTKNTNGISSNIRVNGKKLKTIQSFKCLGAMVTDEGSMTEVRSRVGQAMAALTKLMIIWDYKNIDLGSRIRLLGSLVMSIFVYSCGTWTLTAEMERGMQTVEVRGFGHHLGISCRDHIANEEVQSKHKM